ncbi:MAG: sel1 repeat family protein [Nitrospira sp.]|nr:sel1 repeat family protein [Nitrospira sp.]
MASNQDQDVASDLYQAGKYQEAFERYRDLAEQGSATSQLALAGMLAEGLGTTRNLEESEIWYGRAAAAGLSEAQYRLGYVHFHRKEYDGALVYYEKAASQGHLQALWRLAWLYREGKGVSVDSSRAYELFCEAAKRGHIFAKRDMALMLLRGHKGVAKVVEGIIVLIGCVVDGVKLAWISDSDDRLRI